MGSAPLGLAEAPRERVEEAALKKLMVAGAVQVVVAVQRRGLPSAAALTAKSGDKSQPMVRASLTVDWAVETGELKEQRTPCLTVWRH